MHVYAAMSRGRPFLLCLFDKPSLKNGASRIKLRTTTPNPLLGANVHISAAVRRRRGSLPNRATHSSVGNESILLPKGVDAGVVIGKGGSNFKKIQSLTGAKLHVAHTGGGEVVEISGSKTAAKQAYELLQRQISTFMSSGGAYPHPLKVLYLLSPEFTENGIVSFTLCNDEVAKGAERSERLYVIRPHTGTDDHPSALDGLHHMGKTLKLKQAQTSNGQFHGVMEKDDVLSMLRDSIVLAASHQPKFSVLKLRFNFGKSFFYNGVQTKPMTFKTLQGKRVGGGADFKGVFSNVLTDAQVAAIKHKLLDMAVFKLVREKHTASIHLEHEATGAGYNASLIRTDGSGLAVRKIKSTTNKLFFLCNCNPPDTPDFRMKLLASYQLQDSDEKRLVEDFCRNCRLEAPCHLSAPRAAGAGLVATHVRSKDKQIYEGTLKDASGVQFTVKVTFSKVTQPTGHTHNEVTGCCAELNSCLQSILQSSNADDQVAADRASTLCHALLGFAESVRS